MKITEAIASIGRERRKVRKEVYPAMDRLGQPSEPSEIRENIYQARQEAEGESAKKPSKRLVDSALYWSSNKEGIHWGPGFGRDGRIVTLWSRTSEPSKDSIKSR